MKFSRLSVKLIFIVALFLVSAMKITDGNAAPMESIFKPYISLSEEFNNNINEVSVGKRKEATSRIQPGIDIKYGASRWDLDAGYSLDYLYYARQQLPDRLLHNARLNSKITIVENFLFIDLRDNYSLTSIDITRNAAEESLTQGQQKTNRAYVSAYIQKNIAPKLSASAGYRYNNTRYFSSDGIERSEHSCFVDLAYELTPKLSLSTNYIYSQNATTENDITRQDASIGFRYEYADKSFLFANGGNSWQLFTPGTSVQNRTWSAGVTQYTPFVTTTLESRTQYADDSQSTSTRQVTYSGRLDKELKRGNVGVSVSYDEYFLTQTGIRDRRRALINGIFNYEFIDRFTGTLNANADRSSVRSSADYPYRLSVSPGISYRFNYDFTVNGTYTYVTYRHGIQDSKDNREIQRVILELRKSF